jgi:hypothetical protein
MLSFHGRVIIGKNIAVLIALYRHFQKKFPGQTVPGEGIPKLGEHIQVAFHARAGDPETQILPNTKLFHMVDIFIRQIHTATVGDPAVNDHDLSVISVIQLGFDKQKRIKGHALYAQPFQLHNIRHAIGTDRA